MQKNFTISFMYVSRCTQMFCVVILSYCLAELSKSILYHSFKNLDKSVLTSMFLHVNLCKHMLCLLIISNYIRFRMWNGKKEPKKIACNVYSSM